MTQEIVPGPEPAPANAPVKAPESVVDGTAVTSIVTSATVEPAAVTPELQPVVPEAIIPEAIVYEPFALPEGMTVEPEALEQAQALFAESRLPQKQAQRFIDLALAREKAAVERGAKAFHDLQAKWVAEIKADPEIGGARLGAAVASASRVLDHLAIPGLREALNMTGAGNHPAVVKAFVRIGRLLAEDRFGPGREGDPPRSPAEVIYGSQPLK